MRGIIPFTFVMTVLSAAYAPQDDLARVTETQIIHPDAGPLHPRLLQFFDGDGFAPGFSLPDLDPIDGTVITFHL